MQAKTIKILYWIFTILLAALMLFSGIMSFVVAVTKNEAANAVMQGLGYPMYMNIILGSAKVLGAIAILQNKFKIIKEWAYAGFVFDILGAVLSFALATGISSALGMIPFVILVSLAYIFWKKKESSN
jgi:FtsH-binding integral membrane protein